VQNDFTSNPTVTSYYRPKCCLFAYRPSTTQFGAKTLNPTASLTVKSQLREKNKSSTLAITPAGR